MNFKKEKRQSRKMSSNHVDWGLVIKPILTNRYGPLNKNEIVNLVKAIIKCESEFFEEDSSYAQFYIAFTALAADKLSQCKLVCQTQVPQISDASAILIRFILSKLNKGTLYEIKWLMPALKSLCEGKSLAELPTTSTPASASGPSSTTSTSSTSITQMHADLKSAVTLLKSCKYPETSKTIVSANSDKESPKLESKRSRSDLSSVILHQLTTPLEAGKISWTPLSEELMDCSELFTSMNISYLQSLNAADTILEVCTTLPILDRYYVKYQEAINAVNIKPLYLPLTQSEAVQIRSLLAHMVADMSVLWQALSLPILEPLSLKRIEKLSECAISALYCAVLASIASSVLTMSVSGSSQKSQLSTASGSMSSGTGSKDLITTEENEEHARFIVDKALEIYTIIGKIFKTSAKPHVYQNHLCFGAWILISGIQGALGASGSSSTKQQQQQQQQQHQQQQTDDPAKTKVTPAVTSTGTQTVPQPSSSSAPTARVNLFKVQQGFGVLNVAIANHSIKLLTELIDDLKLESSCNDLDALLTNQTMPHPAGFNILESYSSLQRVLRVLNTATLHQLFTFLATVTYRKACALKRANAKDRTECEPISYSDSTTYFNDTLSCSDNSEEDDSESYLGHWFKETISPEIHEDPANTQQQDRANEGPKTNLVPVGDEPHEYLDLAGQIFGFMDQFFANKNAYLQRYVKAGLSDQQMLLLANILKDLDRDAARGDTESAACPKWQLAMMRFSGAVGRYLHNLISASLLSESLQSNLLQHLSVSPWSTDTNAWPLQVYPSTLSVLVQIIILKPTQEKEAACLSVWHRLVNTLVEGVCATSVSNSASDVEYEDLNMEHAQLLLFLFHSLNLMQKKSILLLTAGGVIRCSEVCRNMSVERPVRNSQIMLLSRLLLLLEYLMKHLYNAPPELLDQVRWNLFSISTMHENQKVTDFINNKTKLTSFCRKDIEEKFRKDAADYLSSICPTFYSLTVVDGAGPQPDFKLDGLAWNFILCTPDKLKYPLLVDALVDILSIADMSSFTKVTIHSLCAMQYCHNICWKLLLSLPPSTLHVESLKEDKIPNLHSLLWSIKCPISSSHYLIVNSLIKQGMYTQYAESLLSTVSERLADIRFSLKQSLLGLSSFNTTVDKDNPRLSHIILLDAIVSHLRAIVWSDKEGIKPNQTQYQNATTNTCGANTSDASTSTSVSPSQSSSSISPVISGGEPEVMVLYTNSNTDTAVETKSKMDIPADVLQERVKLNRELLSVLIATTNTIAEMASNQMLDQLSDASPLNVVELLIPIVSSKNPVTTELHDTILKLLSNEDKEVITSEWPKCLEVPETAFTSRTYKVEEYTLMVIDAHITELTQGNNYSLLSSLKHCLKSLLNLINLLLPQCNIDDEYNWSTKLNDDELEHKLKAILMATMMDMRSEFVYDVSEKCMQTLMRADGSETDDAITESQQLLAYEYTIKYCYKLLLECAEELRQHKMHADSDLMIFNETTLFAVLKTMVQMLDKPLGVKAMYQYFNSNGEGSLVDLMLHFTGTTMSLAYAKKLLQFFERLFQEAESSEHNNFPMDDLVMCFGDITNVDGGWIKAWLTHIIYGPSGVNQSSLEAGDKGLTSTVQPSSTPSSNAQTPTNMATVSAMPSISDQLALDAEAMETDDDGAGPTGNNDQMGLWKSNPDNCCLTNQSDEQSPDENERNGVLLLKVVKYIVREGRSPPAVSMMLFQALLQMGQTLIAPPQETSDFADILQIMITLADTAQGRGHTTLFNASIMWLEITKLQILEKSMSAKNITGMMPQMTLENISALLKYFTELLQSLGYKGSKTLSPPWDEEMQHEPEEAAAEGSDEDDSTNDDSDEDNLNNKLCTFSQTQKEFMNQHWYHCHTCNMVNTMGVCSVCARVCHKGHDVSYAKYGNFFCDCGAKEDGSCQALSRRQAGGCHGADGRHGQNSFGTSFHGGMNALTGKKRSQTPPSQIQNPRSTDAILNERLKFLGKLLEANREALQNTEQWNAIVRCILEFFDFLMPSIRENCAMYSIVGCHKRAKTALERLHTTEQTFQLSENLMMATLGSQEGAFENVRMSYSGDQGQTIKQLISSGLVRRVALTCLSSPHGKRQHLAVSLEKGKVTILQLSVLLKQADAAKRKLTLTQLTTAPIPCTVLSLTANPANEELLAVCGLKECYILTFDNTGAGEHMVLTPQLENGNFIKKAIWLPGSQTMLALVTADYVKIYELSEDSYSPKYYFLVAVGKIRDCTFVYQDGVYYMLIIASSGYIYYQKLDDQSLAKHGDFYVTNTLELNHPQIQDVNGHVGGGGISVYYSHAMQILFFSYSLGNFMAPMSDINKGVKCVSQLQTGPANKSSSSKSPPQSLCQWTEVNGHPGIVCALLHNSNNPVVFMFTPERIIMQEIKAQSSKSRIMDMVAIRHTVSGCEKTTLILLCEDGSLRIYTAHPENTNYWLSPHVQSIGNQLYSSSRMDKSGANRKSKKKSSNQQKSVGANGSPVFPIDFFEHCTILPDVEFGGNDLLQIYNKQKLKTRLFSTGMFVASTKPSGFTLEIYNNDSNTVIVGIRVLLGTQDTLRAPQGVTILGRTIPTVVRKARWFDIPLTREEILQSDKSLKVLFGKSHDPENVCMLDSIEVYGKSKDLVGWPDDNDDVSTTGVVGPAGAASSSTPVNGQTALALPAANVNDGYNSITNLDKMVSNLLEVLDCSLTLLGNNNLPGAIKLKATKTATSLILLPTHHQVQLQSRYVLATLFGNRNAYHSYKDLEVLSYVNNELLGMKTKLLSLEDIKDIDPECFYRLVLLVRGIAVTRPQSLTKICEENKFDIIADAMLIMKKLYEVTPDYEEPVSVVPCGLSQPASIVECIVTIIHAFALSDLEQVERMVMYLIQLLKYDSCIVSHGAKASIIQILGSRSKRRKVAIVTPPTCSTPTPSNAVAENLIGGRSANDEALDGSAPAIEGAVGGNAVADEAGAVGGAAANADGVAAVARSNSGEFDPLGADAQALNFEAFIGGGFPQLLGLQQDADDEAIMDIAIALSLRDDGDIRSLQQGLAYLQGIRNAAGNLHNIPPLDGNNMAGAMGGAASVSAGGSDDEGSNVATDGSTLRTSPAEAAGSGGSESGGSGVESIGGTSGRSSTYGDQANSSPPRSATIHGDLPLQVSKSSTSSTSTGAVSGGVVEEEQPTTSTALNTTNTVENDENIMEMENLARAHELRLAVLEKLSQNIHSLDGCNGLQALPLLQVLLVLTGDLNGNNEKDQKVLNELLLSLVRFVDLHCLEVAHKMATRSPQNEVFLVVLCLFGVLMGKTKSKQAGTTSPPHQFKDNGSFVASKTAAVLSTNNAFTFCLVIMEQLQPHWKRVTSEQNQPAAAQSLLKPIRYGPKPDISALIPHNYLKSYPEMFDCYDSLLTEVAVRLPYQILRLSSTHPGTYDWYHSYCENMTYSLCEYMMLNMNALLRRQIRKLLMYICGSKEKFRMFRDGHSLDAHFNLVKDVCSLFNTKGTLMTNQSIPILSYDSLVELTEHLRTCQEISQVRTGNWQKFCLVHEDVVPVLIEIACYQLDDGVSPVLLQLLQAALCNNFQAVKQQQQQQQPPNAQQPHPQPQQAQPPTSTSSTAVATKSRSDREKSEDIDLSFDSKFDPAHCTAFIHQLFRFVSDALLSKFIRIFLLETNITSIRWQAHSIIFAIYEYANNKQREKLINILWNMWPLVPAFGRRTAQFVDILGYLTLSTKSIVDKLPEYTEKAVDILRQQNDLLCKHPNAPIYTTLEQILQVNGYYLESEPCLVCNNPEVPMTNIKLPSIKSDSKYTTTTMIVKLVQSHTISKLIVRIADLKRTKMVRTINIYYNNRTVQAVVELKNRPAMWHKARTAFVQSAQTEVKIDFPLPITACNLMIEYSDFYETVTGSSENLQCPRCSAAVPAYPGVCANCGENVFQCHKCRAINYDEKDPFLCHSCGFCKYAKFDFSIYGRACCAVDPIESAEDRAKTVQIIHSSLERADRIYRQLQTNKQMLELLIQKVTEQRCSDRLVEDNLGAVHNTSQVNKIIQLLAQKYCVESRTSFEELSKIVQKVKACRSELVTYDRIQMDQPNRNQCLDSREGYSINRCYGCALSSTEQCLTLLRAMASNYECRIGLYNQGLVEELAQHNLRRGTPQIQDEVRNLLVLLTKGNRDACMNLLHLINERVKTALLGVIPLANLDAAIHHEMVLLEVLIGQDDFCWEEKLKIVFELFLMTSRTARGPVISVVQPCLRIMQAIIAPTVPTSKINRDLYPGELSPITTTGGLTVDFKKWLSDNPEHSFDGWRARMPQNTAKNIRKAVSAATSTTSFSSQDAEISAAILHSVMEQICSTPIDQQTSAEARKQRHKVAHDAYLSDKYGRRWRNFVLNKGKPNNIPLVLKGNWLQPILFNTNSRFGRQLACSLITSLSRTHERKREILNLLTGFLKCVGDAGETSAEFLALYRGLASDPPWRQYLVLKGVLGEISQLLTTEIVKIHRLEETTLSSDLSQGYALRQFVELLSLFLEISTIRQTYKTRLLGPVLEGYLSLRKLVVQRTRLIDDAQEKLLEMLEEMTSGTEEETRAFMEILIDTVEKTRINDIKTPVFIFERLYSIIHPEENDESEFFMTLEKDPQQEDFLQGRMLGNPYPSTEVGLGPLMRDIKNKICTDCELIALLEDDNGMELLVSNKIISLDLPVKDVYKKIWLAEGGERDAMRIVYRMRGLLGDATEEFVETLNNKSQEEVDNEQLYRLANVLADCNGLKVMLDRIGSLKSISRTRELLQVLLKLFLISVKVRRCQEVLCQPELGAINTLLKVLQMCLQSENDSIQSAVTEQLLEIMETILSKAANDTLDSFLQFSLTFGGPEYVSALISCTDCANVRNNPSVLRHLIRVLAALVYGNEVKMALLCENFKDVLDFDRFDTEHTADEEFKMELFCVLTNQIEHNCIGGTLKDYIVSLGIVEKAIEYITKNAPCVKPTLLRTDSDELKEFISRPSLKYILRFLTGLATQHEPSQLTISKDIIPIIHRLEQVSSDEHVGSLAENLLEALCTDEATSRRVQEVRDFTRAEKKRMAMVTREKQLDALGMRTNEKGQVTAKGSILQKIEKLRDETGLTCFICREGYACQPAKVLGIYTFTKRCNLEEFELKSRKTIGFTTVTHFNVVHVDCHTSAIRLARGRDEWERASLQNANTRCNGLLPLWGPDVAETAFSACMTRHSSYMQECTQRCEISFMNTLHDLKLLLARFAWERSFHDDAGGGGPQSNMHFVPYSLFYAVYLLLSSRTAVRDTKTLLTYLQTPPSGKWLECGYEVDGPLYMTTISLALHSPEMWTIYRLTHLDRLLAIAQARHVSPSVQCKALLSPSDRQAKDYAVYKPFLMFWAMIDLLYSTLFKTISSPKEEDWSIALFDYIRKSDENMLKSTDAILQTFTEEYLPCTSFAEFCDVAGLLNSVGNADDYIERILTSLPTTTTPPTASSSSSTSNA